ncbi:MAG TPA: hypothetical protein VIL20_05810 [Sandaracinaceae bacterium]
MLNRLTNREMIKLGQDLVRPGGKQRQRIEEIPAARALVPTIERANEAVVVAQVPGDGAVAELTDQLGRLDVRHDDCARSIDRRFEAELYATTDEALRRRIAALRNAAFSTGMTIITASYTQQAGEVPLRAARITDDDRAFMRALKTYEGRTVEDLFDELQDTATQIGALEKRRQELGEEGEAVIKNRAARFQWIRAINALNAVLASENVDPQPILGPIFAAEAEADRRAARAASRSTDGTDGATGTDASGGDGELDPPIPTDEGPTDPA